MPIALTCPKCSRRHKAPDALAGRQAKCGCGEVLHVPAAAATAAVATAAEIASPKPKLALSASKPAGSWHAPGAAPQVAPAPLAAPSVFDEISPADLDRGKPPVAAAAPALVPGPAPSPASQVVGDVMSRIKNDMAERERTEAEKLPHSVALAMAGVGVPGGLSLAGGFAALLALGTEFIEDVGGEFLILLFVINFLYAALAITAAVLIYLRVPFSRPLGYIAGGITLVSGLCNPINFLCGLLTLWFLSMPDTGQYLMKKGKLGVIEW
jgi:hypothetical protein